MFEGPVTGNIPEVLDNGEVTDGTHVTAGQLALALTPYAQVTDLAVNTAASGNNAAAIQSLQAGQQRAGAGNRTPCHGGGPGHHGRAGGRARKQHRRAAELADHGSLQQGRPVGLRRAGGRGGQLDGVDLKLSNYSITAAMNGSIASANNATLATVAANYGLKTVVDQHSLDIAARRRSAGLRARKQRPPPSRGCRPPRRTPAP